MSRYVTLPHAVYGVCTPSRCVCTQFCGVRHPNVSICVYRSIFHSSLLTFPKFHLLRCSSVAPSLSSNAVKGLAAAVGRALTNYYCETWYHGKREGKAIKKNRKETDIKTKFPISYLLRAWKRKGKTRKRSRKEA